LIVELLEFAYSTSIRILERGVAVDGDEVVKNAVDDAIKAVVGQVAVLHLYTDVPELVKTISYRSEDPTVVDEGVPELNTTVAEPDEDTRWKRA
jgi:hypothetical protein